MIIHALIQLTIIWKNMMKIIQNAILFVIVYGSIKK